ncbi:hypothetical protein TSMEX_011205 [Taenia solium]|eukprot:TsM_000352700 transcript=TsM_000352700 gene=TsM_000352700
MPVCGGFSAPAEPSDGDKQLLTPVIKNYIAQQLDCRRNHGGNVWHVRVHEALPCYGGKVEVHSHKVAAAGDSLTYF